MRSRSCFVWPHTQKENNYNPLFCSYLAGLIEGDGTIIVPKIERSNKGRLYYPAWWSRKSFVWDKLSNSGNTLKFLALSYIWKYISGWSNYSGTVTAQEINESEMGYRGSKSIHGLCNVACYNSNIVKEQRAYGSYRINSVRLRCALTGYESSCFLLKDRTIRNQSLFKEKRVRYSEDCQAKILSNHRNSMIRSYCSLTTLQQTNSINPWFITGFADGESSFILSVLRNNKYKTGWSIKPKFQIAVHNKDMDLLLQILNYLGLGKIYKHGAVSAQYRLDSIKEI